MTCHIIQTFPPIYHCHLAVQKPNLSPSHFSFVTDEDLCGQNVLQVNYCPATRSLKNQSLPLGITLLRLYKI